MDGSDYLAFGRDVTTVKIKVNIANNLASFIPCR